MNRAEAQKSLCHKVDGLLGPFLDGELDAPSLVEVDEHLEACSSCRERAAFQRALKVSVKRACGLGAHRAPDALRERLKKVMAEERASEPAPVSTRSARPPVPLRRGRPWVRKAANVARTWVPVSAAAAALLFTWSSRRNHPSDARLIPRNVLGDLVAEHSHPLPPERTDPSGVRALERYVGVPVNLPFAKDKEKARLVGARIMPLQSERAAMLQYEMDRGGSTPQRVSVFIYDPARIHLDGEGDMNAVGASRVGRQNGYSVAVTQHNGVGYAVASDLGPEMTAQLANDVE